MFTIGCDSLQNIFGLPAASTVNEHENDLAIHIGINERMIEQAIELYDGALVVEASDEARVIR